MRRLEFNPLVEGDIDAAVEWYSEAGTKVATAFLSQLRSSFLRIAKDPQHFHFDPSGWRRFNMKKFPYHILFVERRAAVRVIMVRNNRQSPDYGTDRR